MADSKVLLGLGVRGFPLASKDLLGGFRMGEEEDDEDDEDEEWGEEQ